jgi:hypothetical protein
MNHDPENGAASGLSLRVSVATYNRVVFPHPQDGNLMLALERKATVLKDGSVNVQAQPFGGGVHILSPTSLQNIVGDIHFDSERSKHEHDFRIMIPSSKWESVKQYCLHQLENPNDTEIESSPDREQAEEINETLQISLEPNQYTVQPAGFVIEDIPTPTNNADVRGQSTVRLYRIFEIKILDAALCKAMLDVSQQYSDKDIGMLAMKDFQNGGRGWANSILTLPLGMIVDSYLTMHPKTRYRNILVDDHNIDASVLAILGNVDIPQYQRS